MAGADDSSNEHGVVDLEGVAALSNQLTGSGGENFRLPEVQVFEHDNYGGKSMRTNLGYLLLGRDWDDKISSIIVVSGRWTFYAHPYYNRDDPGFAVTLGPGYYPDVDAVGIGNDQVTSFKGEY
jgi:hypothetical protein